MSIEVAIFMGALHSPIDTGQAWLSRALAQQGTEPDDNPAVSLRFDNRKVKAALLL